MQAEQDKLDRIFAALADPTRREIVRALLAQDRKVSDLAAPFESSLAAVSKHLHVLIEAGLVSQHRDGRIKWCRLDVEGMHMAMRWMEGFGQFAARDFEVLEHRLSELGLLADDDHP